MIDNLGFHTNHDHQAELDTIQKQINALTGRIEVGNFYSYEDRHNTHGRLHDLRAQKANLVREVAMENQRLDRLANAIRHIDDPRVGFIAYVVFGPNALPVQPLYEVRLLDSNGYTVPGTVRTNLPASRVEQAKRDLMAVHARKHARLWGAHVSEYQVQVTPF